ALPPELVFIYAMRPDLQQSYDIGTGSGASAFLLWWLSFGAADFADLSELVDRAIMRDLHWAQMPAIASAGQLSLTPLMAAIRHERSDLRSAFDVSSADGMAAFWRWWMAEAVRDYRETIDPSAPPVKDQHIPDALAMLPSHLVGDPETSRNSDLIRSDEVNNLGPDPDFK